MGVIIGSAKSSTANHYGPEKELDMFHSTHVWKTQHTQWEESRFILCSPPKSPSIVSSGSQKISETVGRLVGHIYEGAVIEWGDLGSDRKANVI